MDARPLPANVQGTSHAIDHRYEQLATIIQSAMDAIVVTDEKQQILIFNAAAEKLFGCRAAEVLGQSVGRFIPQRFRAAHDEQVRFFERTSGTCRRMGKLGMVWGLCSDGKEIPLEISISQAECGGGRLFMAILRRASEQTNRGRHTVDGCRPQGCD